MNQPERRSRKTKFAEATFALVVGFELVNGSFAEFHQLVSENAALSVELEPGCLRFDVLTPLDQAKTAQVLLYELYVDRAAFDLHLASDHYKTFDARTRSMVSRKTVAMYKADERFKQPAA